MGPEKQASTLCVIVKRTDDSEQNMSVVQKCIYIYIYIFAYSCFGILVTSLILMFIYCNQQKSKSQWKYRTE
jgi:hypothetical protein